MQNLCVSLCANEPLGDVLWSFTIAWAFWLMFSMTGMGNIFHKAPEYTSEVRSGVVKNENANCFWWQRCFSWFEKKVFVTLTGYRAWVYCSPCEGVETELTIFFTWTNNNVVGQFEKSYFSLFILQIFNPLLQEVARTKNNIKLMTVSK